MVVDLRHGDCVAVMATLDENSVGAIVTDPPYGLEFMGKEWDRLDTAHAKRDRSDDQTGAPAQEWHRLWASAALRVLKPGGHLVAFGGTRTFHRLTCALEDAGFEIRDCLAWMYGSGFPKSLDVSKAIDKAAGAGRAKVPASGGLHKNARLNDDGWAKIGDDGADMDGPEAVTDLAREWSGWGTALKPAWEPIILARKPLSEKNVAANVARWGTGAINVDGCRIGTTVSRRNGAGDGRTCALGSGEAETAPTGDAPPGRWPANVALDEEAARMLDEQSGGAGGGFGMAGGKEEHAAFGGGMKNRGNEFGYGDSGGASRFFYTAKASPDERGTFNSHPTVKPVALMKWLVTMVAPPGALVLDPFLGSGTTALAARDCGNPFVGIEKDEGYLRIAAKRLAQQVFPMEPA